MKSNKKMFDRFVDKILKSQSDLSSLESSINRKIYELYEFDKEEIFLIESQYNQ